MPHENSFPATADNEQHYGDIPIDGNDTPTALAQGQPRPAPLAGQVALITGGTNGIGKASALRLAQMGAELILVGRDQAKGQRAVAAIQAATPGSRVTFWRYDLSLMRGVQHLAAAVQQRGIRLDIFIHSAGVMLPRRTLTAEGLETVFAIQYLARFYLTNLLLEQFTANPRIVNISAGGTIPMRLNFDNLNGEKFYNGVYTLIHESIANDLFAVNFMQLHPVVRFYNYGPAYVRTELFVEMPWWFKLSTATIGRFSATTAAVASQDVVTLLATDRPSGFYSRHLKPVTPSRYRTDSAIQARLLQWSAKMIAEALQKDV